MTSPALSDVVESVYDSIADAGRWQGTLESICDLAEGHLASLAVVDTVTNAARFSVACGDPAVLAPLMDEYSAEVPFYSALPKMDIDVPFTVDAIYALQGPSTRQTWLDSRIAREWVTPNQLDDFFWVPLMKQPSRIGSLIVVTHKNRHQITVDELRMMSSLSPHVRRAVTIGDMFEAERRKVEIFQSIVESLAHPVLVVAHDMQILFANPAAEALMEDKSAISSARGQLSFNYGPANVAVCHAIELGIRDEFALGPAGINVPLAKVSVPAVAHVMPLARRDVSARIAQRAAAAVFIATAGSAPLPAIEAIAALFGLTAAEKRIAGHVAAGLTRKAIASASGVSDGTVKSQLAAIFDKTGAGDQRELELLIRELSPPLVERI
jgi:DNA-binding CsgD family transcriptional regulator/PAS domain-containing protein